MFCGLRPALVHQRSSSVQQVDSTEMLCLNLLCSTIWATCSRQKKKQWKKQQPAASSSGIPNKHRPVLNQLRVSVSSHTQDGHIRRDAINRPIIVKARCVALACGLKENQEVTQMEPPHIRDGTPRDYNGIPYRIQRIMGSAEQENTYSQYELITSPSTKLRSNNCCWFWRHVPSRKRPIHRKSAYLCLHRHICITPQATSGLIPQDGERTF